MIRKMTIEDYDGAKALWLSIKGFAIRSLDDSREGVARFLSRNPDTSVVAVEDGRIVGAILCGCGASGRRWWYSAWRRSRRSRSIKCR